MSSENRAEVSDRPLGRKYRLYFSLFAFHFSLLRLSPAIEMAGYHCQAPLGLPSIHFSLWQTADKPIGKRRFAGRQTAD